MTQQYRQGDVLLVRVGDLPADARPLPREGGKVVLAHGEATGHHHAVLERDAELFAPGEASAAAERYLRVGQGGATVTHQEHAPIALPEGVYEVRRQVEYTPQAIVRVVD